MGFTTFRLLVLFERKCVCKHEKDVFISYPQKLIPQNALFFYPSSAKITSAINNSALINSLKVF